MPNVRNLASISHRIVKALVEKMPVMRNSSVSPAEMSPRDWTPTTEPLALPVRSTARTFLRAVTVPAITTFTRVPTVLVPEHVVMLTVSAPVPPPPDSTVIRTPAEQLLSVSLSPLTGSTHAP